MKNAPTYSIPCVAIDFVCFILRPVSSFFLLFRSGDVVPVHVPALVTVSFLVSVPDSAPLSASPFSMSLSLSPIAAGLVISSPLYVLLALLATELFNQVLLVPPLFISSPPSPPSNSYFNFNCSFNCSFSSLLINHSIDSFSSFRTCK